MHNPVAHYLRERLPKRPGFTVNPVQIDYAEAICAGLARPGQFHFNEASTGIGKSLAYLLCLADWVARGHQHGRRAVISTHSRSLQRQLLAENNQAIIADYLAWQGLPALTMGLRMGRQNYVSPTRLAHRLGAPDLETVVVDLGRPNAERELAQWALETEGCLLDLVPEQLPDGLTPQDIALTDHEPTPAALSEHFDAMRSCDLLVINHTLLAIDLVTQGQVTAAEEPYALLLDEAEHYPEAAEQALSQRLSFRSTLTLLRSMGLKTATRAWQTLFDDFRSPARAGEVTIPGAAEQLVMVDALSGLLRARPSADRYDDATWQEWRQVRQEADAILRHLRNTQGPQRVLLQHSPVEGLPGLVVPAPAAGASLKSNADKRVTLLTSATLSDLQHGPGEAATFDFMRGRLVMGTSDSRMGLTEAFEPLTFGDLMFQFPADMPAPLYQTDAGHHELAPTFAKRAIREILACGEGRTLVLCGSYHDVAVLKRHWPEEAASRLVTHAAGEPLNQIAESLPRDAILVTPAGWEGLSPQRQDGESFWATVVILRNPRPAPSAVEHFTLVQSLMAKAGRPDEASRIATVMQTRKDGIRAAHKLRQGIGRAIRHPDDSATIVILDPRFPRPDGEHPGEGMRTATEMLGAIPHRFMGRYRQACKQVKEESKKPRRVAVTDFM